MDKRWAWWLYYIGAALWSALCLYGLFDIALNAEAAQRFALEREQLIAGFALVGLLSWLPLLIYYLRQKSPRQLTVQQTFDRMNKEFHSWIEEEERNHRHNKRD
ncbi:hypothetical protein L0B52_02675 [Suttonella sp. R2A3]|uniref:hypothetical protein n=1 Tax=Suttonella sp. R2A3 TaxID=2908648 RepID=UPI001F29BB13|nr:hypothetical protein [Suttonella sp. R2A3]UJF25065.1 hypothetical protein L0B52_02675 [Suttonella sp. R2A3]